MGEPRQLLDTLRQFATLNSARIDPKRRELLFADIGVLFKAMSRDPSLGFSYEDIGNIAGKGPISTISRRVSGARVARSNSELEMSDPMASPIQIILDPGEFQEEVRDAGGGGPKKDFFAQRNDDFRAHKRVLGCSA